ncbi:hypothetical protein ACFFU1_07660 [Algibacter miyuki]|uniref:Uncharacterized protein n=1 Tax=Algibacter miyuki TaxID=1306933 RepID=A0ABV5GYP9_9FLAO|nr:hypothetical protein [Algibacter miyuki]MDN3667032.1 hypothetical protein [Algibacter miyuki]
MKITKLDLSNISDKITPYNTTIKGTKKFLNMSVSEYINDEKKFRDILTEDDYQFFLNIKTNRLDVYKTKDELEKLYKVSMSFFKLIPHKNRESLLQGSFLSVDVNCLCFLTALIYADKSLSNL